MTAFLSGLVASDPAAFGHEFFKTSETFTGLMTDFLALMSTGEGFFASLTAAIVSFVAVDVALEFFPAVAHLCDELQAGWTIT